MKPNTKTFIHHLRLVRELLNFPILSRLPPETLMKLCIERLHERHLLSPWLTNEVTARIMHRTDKLDHNEITPKTWYKIYKEEIYQLIGTKDPQSEYTNQYPTFITREDTLEAFYRLILLWYAKINTLKGLCKHNHTRDFSNCYITAYHATTTDRIPNILEQGLLPDQDDTGGMSKAYRRTKKGFVFVFTDEQSALRYAEILGEQRKKPGVVFYISNIKAIKLMPDLDHKGPCSFKYKGQIPPQELRVINNQ